MGNALWQGAWPVATHLLIARHLRALKGGTPSAQLLRLSAALQTFALTNMRPTANKRANKRRNKIYKKMLHSGRRKV